MTWILVAACTGPASDETSGSPSIWVESALAFDDVDIGTDAPLVETLWVENVGHGVLSVDVPYFAQDGAFSVAGERVTLERMEAYGYDVTFDPQTPFVHEGWLVIESDDPLASSRQVSVRGEAFAPVLEVSTSPIDLGIHEIGCDVFEEIELRNGGNDVLVVTPSLVGSDELVVDSGVDPIGIPPSMSAIIPLRYVPVDAGTDSFTLTLESSDPFLTWVAIEVAGEGKEWGTQTDVFEVGLRQSDIVLVVDNSRSMSTEQPQLMEHIEAFVDGLDAAAVDYQIGVISTDTSTFYGPVVTPGTADPVGALDDQLTAMGTDGSGTARAHQMLYNCVQAGGDCSASAGFLRDDALLVGIIVSDDPDQSALAPESYVEYFWTLKDDPALVRVHALAGSIPVPTCSTCASAGFGYDEAVDLTGGTYLDICADDWDESLRVLAEQSVLDPSDSVQLSADPVGTSIEVSVDGSIWGSGWTYDGESNEVVFFDPLPVPSVVEVSYTVRASCD